MARITNLHSSALHVQGTGSEPDAKVARDDLADDINLLRDIHPDNPVFNVPFRAKGGGMVGREDALQKVREQLTAGQRTSIGHTAAFQGLGGLGKTQLAVEYAHRFRGEYPLGVLWINADQEIETQLIQMARQARWIYPEARPQDILEMTKQRLQTRSEYLVIFDNVEDRAAIEPYLPLVNAESHLLLTSRAVQKGFVPIDISLLDVECSFQLLLKESGRDMDSLSEPPEPEQKAAGEIAVILGGLPLALEIAGAYLKYVKSCTFQSYMGFLTENLHEAMKGYMLSGFTKHEENLFLILQVSKPVLAQVPLLNDILDILAWSGSAFMGVSLLAALLGKTEAELSTPLQIGESLHLLQKTQGGERYDIHHLVRRVLQEQYPIAHREQWIKDTCQRLGDWFEVRRKEFRDLPVLEMEMDHLKQWLNHVKPYHSSHVARLTWLQGYPPYYWGKYRESRRLVQAASALLSESSEENPKLKANILDDLGYAYSKQEEFKKGLECQTQALKIRQQLFGEQHPDTALSIYNVGKTYVELGDYKKALDYQLRALEIQKKLLGEHHPDTANSLGSAGCSYLLLGNPNAALDYVTRAYDILYQMLGEFHQNTVVALANIVYSLFKLKRFQEAGERLDEYLDRLPLEHPKFQELSDLKKLIQKKKRKGLGLHGMPGKKKKRKR
jgi:tetratricopeptide (TPR) repeat protein